MKPSSDIHALISSLTPNEKGYFKKFCQRNGAGAVKKYIALFDAIAAQTVYDEEKLKKKLNDPVLSRNLPSEKNYLYHLILEAVLAGKTTNDPLYECELLLAKARWLSSRSFYESSYRFAEKAQRKAIANEYFTLALDAMDLELLLWQYLPREERRPFDNIIRDRKQIRAQMNVTDDLRLLDMDVIRLFQEIGIGRNAEQLRQYKAIYDESIKIRESNAPLPLRAQMFFYNIGVFYFNVIGNAEESLNDLNAMIALVDSHPVIRRERLSFYISSLNNVILLLLHMGRFDEAQSKIDQLSNIDSESQNHKNTLFVTRFNTQFELYTITRNWDKMLSLCNDLKTAIAPYESKLDNRYTGHIRFAAFRSCFYTGHYKEAQQWINQLVNKTSGEPFKSEIVTIARLAEIVLHETLGNYDLAETLLLSAKRFLNKTHSLYAFEKVMLDFFSKRLTHPEDPSADFAQLQKKLSEVSEDILEKRVFNYFNFKDWARARESGCLIKDLI